MFCKEIEAFNPVHSTYHGQRGGIECSKVTLEFTVCHGDIR